MTCISTSDLVRYDTRQKYPRSGKKTEVGACGQWCTCSRPSWVAGIWSTSPFVITAQPFPWLANACVSPSTRTSRPCYVKPLSLWLATDHEEHGRFAPIRKANKKLSWCWEACATRYHPEGGKVSAGRRIVQHCHCSAFLSDRKFQSPPEWQAPIPVRISQP